MAQPIYRYAGLVDQAQVTAGANLGLWFNRFYNAFDRDWKVGEEGKSDWIRRVAGQQGNAEQLKRLADRMETLGRSLSAECDDFATQWHFATGLGISHPVENGITWHHTLGLPYLPASGVKGLLRGWVETWMEPADKAQKETLISRWFGSSSSEQEGAAGGLIFFDALPTGPVELACDVMTPHMGQWYAQGDTIREQDYATAAPADWHSPVPVPFLVVSNATFRFMIAPRLTGDADQDQLARSDAAAAMAQLSEALQFAGAGAKTAAGYGRMICPRMHAAMLEAKRMEEEAAKEAREALARAAAGLTPDEVVWPAATASWNKSNASLTLVQEGARATATGAWAKELFEKLGEAAQKRLKDGKKPLVVRATLNKQGQSMFTILSLQEI